MCVPPTVVLFIICVDAIDGSIISSSATPEPRRPDDAEGAYELYVVLYVELGATDGSDDDERDARIDEPELRNRDDDDDARIRDMMDDHRYQQQHSNIATHTHTHNTTFGYSACSHRIIHTVGCSTVSSLMDALLEQRGQCQHQLLLNT